MTFTVGMAVTADVEDARRGLQIVDGKIRSLRAEQYRARKEAEETRRAVAAAPGAIAGQVARLVLQAAGIGSITAALAASVRAAAQAERSQMRLEAVVRATGGAARRSADEIDALARQIGQQTLASTAEVREAAAQLLTFRSVAGETFDRTLWLAQDLAEDGFGSLSSATVQLGKALEDPIQGISALQRVGVSFSAMQREQIANFVETGRLAEAQRVILEGVERQVGGVGVGAGGGLAGAYDTLGEELRDFSATLGQVIAESLQLEAAMKGIAGGIAAVNAQLNRQETAQGSARRLLALRAELERVESDPRTRADPLSTSSVRADLQARIAAERRTFDELDRAERSRAAERRAMETATAAEMAAEAEEAARRIVEASGATAEASGAAAAAVRGETSAVEALIAALGLELALLGETDAVQRALLENREALVGATDAQRAAVEGLLATIAAEQIALDQSRQMWDFFGRSALDALEGIALQGDSVSDVLEGLIRQLARAALEASLLGSGPLAGLFGGGLLPALVPAMRRATGGMVFGPGGPTDDRVPILASNGEFVVNAAATARHRPLLEAINAGVPRFATGGPVGDVFGPGGPSWMPPRTAPATAAMAAAAPPVIIKVDARGAVEGEAERFARYFDRRGPKLVQEAVAAMRAGRARGYE